MKAAVEHERATAAVEMRRDETRRSSLVAMMNPRDSVGK